MMKRKVTLILSITVLVFCVVCQYTFYLFYDPYPIQMNLPLWFSIPRIIFLIPAFIILRFIFKKKEFQLKSVVLLLISVLVLLIVLVAPGKYIYVIGMKYRLNNFIEVNNDMLERYINSDEKINKKIKLNWMAIAPKDKLYQVDGRDGELFIILYQQKPFHMICLIYSDKEHNFGYETKIISLAPKWSLLIGSAAVSLSDEY